MSGKITLIIFLLYGLFHVMQLVLQASAKRKEQERIRQEAERRRFATGQMSAPRTIGAADDGTGTGDVVARPGPASTPPAIRAGRPGDDLAARRRSQLEELRTKRDVRRTAPIPTPIRPGTSAPLPRSPQSPTIPPQAAREERARVREMDQKRVQREEQSRRMQQELQASQRRKEAETIRLAAERKKLEVKSRPTLENANPASLAAVAGATATAFVRQAKPPVTVKIVELLRTPHSIRHAMILKEVLDKPLALRNP